MGKDDPPRPPDPVITAGAQTSSNVSTAVANAFLNNINQNTPLGSLRFDTTGNYNFTDPSTGFTYSIPTFTANQTLGPTQQLAQDQSEGAKLNLATLANQQSFRLNQALGSGINLSGAPAQGVVPQLYSDIANFAPLAEIQHTFGDAGQITRDYGPADNYSADRARVEEAMFGRLNPQLALERQRTEQQLADRGIQAGQAAYSAGMGVYGTQANDARLAVIQAAGQEQARMDEMAARRAGFQNAAQQQAFQQAQQRGQFWNAAEQQRFAEAKARTENYNLTARQQYLEDPSTLRQQYLTEQYALRNQPINEISALLSGSQVQQPTFTQTPRNQIPTTDIAGLINQNFQQQFQNFQQQSQNTNQLIGGIFGAAGNIGRGFAMSDRDVKENIHRIGTVFTAEERPVQGPGKKRLPIYEYSYKGDPSETRHVGPMAQDVEKTDPGAVRTFGGIKHIDVPRVMGSILRAA